MFTLTNLLIFFGFFYLAAAAYSRISGKKPQNLLSTGELTSSILSKEGGWGILVPISGVLVLIYNLIATTFWFIGVVIQFIAWLLRWIWDEVIVAGGYFLFSIIWHYLIKWPWKILLFAFTKIFSSLKIENLWIGSLAIFVSLAIMFVGRYLVQIFELWGFLTYFFGVLAVIPLGVGLSAVIQKIKVKDADDASQSRKKFTTHLLYIIAGLFAILCIQAVIVYIGTFTYLSPILSTLLAGGNLIGTLLILANSVIIIFSLAALPSFSDDYNGPNKSIAPAFFKYLLSNRWGMFLVSGPAMLIPLIIACIIPYVVTQGVSYLAGKVSNEVFDYRLSQLKKSQDSIPIYNYGDWLDTDRISDDSIKVMQAQDRKRINAGMSYRSNMYNQQYLETFYKAHYSELGSAPVGAMLYLFNQFYSIENEAISTTPYTQKFTTIDTSQLSVLNNERIPQIQQERKRLENEASYLRTQLKNVRNDNPIQPNVNTPIQERPQTKSESPAGQTRELDYSENQRVYYREQIESSNKEISKADKKLERAKVVAAHLQEIYKAEQSNNSNNEAASKIAYLLISLWLCLLVGIAFGAAIPMFAFVNHHLYQTDKGGDLYLMEKIQHANTVNANQPLLGVILFSVLFYTQIFSEFSFLSNLKDLVPNLNTVDQLFSKGKTAPTINSTEQKISIDTAEAMPVIDSVYSVGAAAAPVTEVFSNVDVDNAPIYTGEEFSYNNNLHVENGAPASSYVVIVSYVVDENGTVIDITPLTSHGYGLEEEIIGAIQRTSGYWQAATKNGTSVKCKMENTFTFGEQ
jgi:hypothetical protein